MGKGRRNVSRLTYTEIAEKSGYSLSHVSRVMRRERRPTVMCMVKLAMVMGITSDEFVRKMGLGKRS